MREPMRELPPVGPADGMAYESAMMAAAATRSKNQRGSGIFD